MTTLNIIGRIIVLLILSVLYGLAILSMAVTRPTDFIGYFTAFRHRTRQQFATIANELNDSRK